MHAYRLAGIALALAACNPTELATPGLRVGALTQETNFGSNPGNLTMYTYVPQAMPPSAPLVVALHGCAQSADAYVGAGWNELADVEKIYLVYPETPSAGGCFGWLSSGDTTRGSGQALSVKQMVDFMKSKYSIDAGRVFVTGLSAGGAMTAVMLATYPDVFAAGATMAGIAYGANIGETKPASQLGDSVRAAYPSFQGPWPRLSVWQGQSDSVVAPSSATALVSQWTNVHGLSGSATAMDTVAGAMHASYADAQGKVVVESYLVPNMGHGTALHVPFAPANGCGQTGEYLLEAGICSTYYAWQFFTAAPGSGNGDGGSAADLGGGAPGTGGSDGSAGGGGPGGGPGERSGGTGCSLGGDAPLGAMPLLLLVTLLVVLRSVRDDGRH